MAELENKYRKQNLAQKCDITDVSNMDKEIVKFTVKDSVFTNLFQDKKYLLQLYKVLHPEDMDITQDKLTDITIKNVLTDNIYNDLGFIVGNRLLILVEAQSTWTMNIIIRALLYLAQTYRDYFERTKQSLYMSKKVQMPKPELYVIYTGDRINKPTQISLSEEFFGGQNSCLDVKVKMIYDGKDGDIINQYVVFTRVCSEQIAIYGRTRQAVLEAIRICKNKNVLKEYLESKEKEVVDIMMILYDEQEVMRSYIECEIYHATQKATKAAEKAAEKATKKAVEKAVEKATKKAMLEGREEGKHNEKIETAKRLLQMNRLSYEEIAIGSGLTLEEVAELANLS